MQAWSIDAVSF